MSEPWRAAAILLAHATAAGGGVLLIGFLLGRLTAAPARRQCVAAWAVRGAVAAAGLCLLPSWITIPGWVPEVGRTAVVPPKPTEVPPEAIPEPDADFAVSDDPTAVVTTVVSPEPAVFVPPEPAAESVSLTDWWSAVVPFAAGLYLIVVAVLLGQLFVGHVALWRLRRTASPAPPRVRDVFAALAPHDPRMTALVVSDRIDAPVCFGLLWPTVVLPRQLAADASADELRWVLAHELDHLRRGDPATAVWAGVARGLFFVWPWFWAVRRDLALSQEYLADAAAATAGGRPADYAAFLVDLSDPAVPRRHSGRSTTLLAAHAVRAGRSDLFRRVNMVLKSDVSRRATRGWASLAAGGLMCAAVVLSGLGWATADDEKPKPPLAEKKDPPRPDADREPDAPQPPKPPAPTSPPRRDGERGERRDGERRDEERRDGERRAGMDELGRLKRFIEEDSVKDGKTDEVLKLVNELERVLMARRGGGMGGGGVIVGGGMPQEGGPFRVEVPFRFDADVFALEAKLKDMFDEYQRWETKPGKDTPEMRAWREKVELARDQLMAARKNQLTFGPQGGAAGGSGSIGPKGGRFGTAVGRIPEALSDQLDLPKGNGLLVMDVAGGSPAEKAGLRRNDILVKFAGKDVPNDERRFMEVVGTAKPGEGVEVVVLRKGKKETLTATLSEPPKPRREGPIEIELRGDRGPKIAFESMAVSMKNDKFDIKATKGEVEYKLKGRIEDSRPVPDTIIVNDGDKSKEYRSPKEMPEQYQPAVRQLLGSVSGR